MEHVSMLQTITATLYPKRTYLTGDILNSHGTTDITIFTRHDRYYNLQEEILKVYRTVAGYKSSIKRKSLIHQFGIKCYNIPKFTCWYGVDARAWVKI